MRSGTSSEKTQNFMLLFCVLFWCFVNTDEKLTMSTCLTNCAMSLAILFDHHRKSIHVFETLSHLQYTYVCKMASCQSLDWQTYFHCPADDWSNLCSQKIWLRTKSKLFKIIKNFKWNLKEKRNLFNFDWEQMLKINIISVHHISFSHGSWCWRQKFSRFASDVFAIVSV